MTRKGLICRKTKQPTNKVLLSNIYVSTYPVYLSNTNIKGKALSSRAEKYTDSISTEESILKRVAYLWY